MNRRGDDFGFLLPLDYGQNLIVLVADDGSGNLSSKLLRVERSDRFAAEITSPAFGMFANGQTQTVTGAVSRKLRVNEPGGSAELSLASLTVAGVPVTLGGAGTNQSFSVPMAPPGCTNSIMPIIISLCWTGETFSATYTNICVGVPLGLLEGYEIVGKSSMWAIASCTAAQSNSQCPDDWYVAGPGGPTPNAVRLIWDEVFELPCDGQVTNVTHTMTRVRVTPACQASSDWEAWTWETVAPEVTMSSAIQPTRGLVLGENFRVIDGGTAVSRDSAPSGGQLVFRAPFYYPAETVVLFTVENASYSVPSEWETGTNVVMDLNQVKLNWGGETLDPVSTNDNSCSYLITVTGGQEYTLDETSFTWPEHSGTTASEFFTTTWLYHSLSFTGFHNLELASRFKIAIMVGHGGADPEPPSAVADVNPNSDIGKFAQEKTDKGYYAVGIVGCWINATIVRVDELRATQQKSAVNWVNLYPGGEDSLTYREVYPISGEAGHPKGPDEPPDYERKTKAQIKEAIEAAANAAAEEVCGTGLPAVIIEVSGQNFGLSSWTVICPGQ